MMTVEEQTRDCVAHREMADGRLLCVYEMLFGNGRLCVGPVGVGWFDDLWCYDTVELALEQLRTWDGTGEPTGWKRHPRTGRRRPDGDAALEYVEP